MSARLAARATPGPVATAPPGRRIRLCRLCPRVRPPGRQPQIVQNLVPGLTRERYEGIAAALRDKLKATPGFNAHYAYESEGGMTVVEIWDEAAQHDAWFDNTVKPNLPVEVIPVKYELANKVTA